MDGCINWLNFEVCRCECKEPNCESQCFPYQYEIIDNSYGCPDCKCDCPDVDCDAQCGGEELGIQNIKDKTGCGECHGCKNSTNKGENLLLNTFCN